MLSQLLRWIVSCFFFIIYFSELTTAYFEPLHSACHRSGILFIFWVYLYLESSLPVTLLFIFASSAFSIGSFTSRGGGVHEIILSYRADHRGLVLVSKSTLTRFLSSLFCFAEF